MPEDFENRRLHRRPGRLLWALVAAAFILLLVVVLSGKPDSTPFDLRFIDAGDHPSLLSGYTYSARFILSNRLDIPISILVASVQVRSNGTWVHFTNHVGPIKPDLGAHQKGYVTVPVPALPATQDLWRVQFHLFRGLTGHAARWHHIKTNARRWWHGSGRLNVFRDGATPCQAFFAVVESEPIRD